MNEPLRLVAIGLAIAAALYACYRLARWLDRQRTLRVANRIAASFSTEHRLNQATPTLRSKLESYRLAKVRSNLGVSSSLHAAATELVREHRLSTLEQG
jgi:hypothetical protein